MRPGIIVLKIWCFIEERIKGAYWLTKCLRNRIKYKKYYIPYSEKEKNTPIVILANGPSLKDDYQEAIKRIKDIKASVAVVNHFALSSYFKQIKPKYYLIADRVFFWEKTSEKNSAIYKVINEEVSWPMEFIVPIQERFFVEERITNPYVKVVPLCVQLYFGPDRYKYWIYKKGVSVPSFVNITIMAIYYALNLGSKKIYLYGVDHTFLQDITVDDQNRLCTYNRHFYGGELCLIPPRNDGTIHHMKDFVYDKYLTFKEHDNIRGYADYLGAEIINCTRCSCIDSYIRLTQIEKEQ